MEIKKKNQFYTVDIEMNEAELQSVIGVFEELQIYKQMPTDSIKGLRGDIYKKLVAVLTS